MATTPDLIPFLFLHFTSKGKPITILAMVLVYGFTFTFIWYNKGISICYLPNVTLASSSNK